MPTIQEQGGLPGILVSAIENHYANKSARQQALADKAHESKISDLIQKRTLLIAKSANLTKGTPDYDEAFNSLRQVDTNLREAYDPQKHPGAIAALGHLLTDHLKLTNSQDRIKKEAGKRNQALTGDERQARLDVAAGPLSPEQQAGVDARKSLADFNAAREKGHTIWNSLHPNSTPEEQKAGWAEADQHLMLKMYPPTQKSVTKPDVTLLILSNGNQISAQWVSDASLPLGGKWANLDGSDISQALLSGAKVAPKQTKPVRGGLVKTKAGQSPTGWVQTWLDPYDPNKVVGYSVTTPNRYYQGTETSRVTTDPYGVTSTSEAKTVPTNKQETDLSTLGNVPILSDEGTEISQGQPPSNTNPAPPAASQHNPPAAPHVSAPKDSSAAAPKVTPREVKDKAVALQGGENMPTDDQDHIPSDAKVNPHLKEAANQLLDGVDIKELGVPTRDKAAVEALARQYGWGRGTYLPRELKQMQNARQFLDMVENSKAFMKALDQGTFQKWKLSVAEGDASKDGAFGKLFHQMAVQNLSPEQQEYLRLQAALMGTVSGLSSVVRSGRPTEATINRLAREIPNVMASANSKDAKARIANIKKELDLALKQGVPKPTVQGKGGSTPPPATSQDGKPSTEELKKLLLKHKKGE